MFVAGQAPDGTIYVHEMTLDEWATTTLVGLDGRTGQVKFRVGSAGRRHWTLADRTGNSNVIVEPMSLVAVGFDGAAYLTTGSEDSSTARAMRGTTIARNSSCAWRRTGRRPRRSWTAKIWPCRGAISGTGGTGSGRGAGPARRHACRMAHHDVDSSGFVDTYRHAYVGPEGAGPVVEGRLPFRRVGDALTGYDWEGNAYDMVTGALKYSAPAGSSFLAPLVGGGAAYRLPTGSPTEAAGGADSAAILADATTGTLETEGMELRTAATTGGAAAVAEAAATALGGDLVEVDAAGLVTRTSSLAGVPDDAHYFGGLWVGGIGEDRYEGTPVASDPSAFPDPNGVPWWWGPRLVTEVYTFSSHRRPARILGCREDAHLGHGEDRGAGRFPGLGGRLHVR